MTIKRRDFLLFLGVGTGAIACAALSSSEHKLSTAFANSVTAASLPKPIQSPPLVCQRV